MGAPRVRCPTCQREVVWTEESPWRPFCSDRCRMVDLGAWFAGERTIPGESVSDPDALPSPDTPPRD
jgi:endogenous inhibitor of DNA gyrase (YacG/DUF329 family)